MHGLYLLVNLAVLSVPLGYSLSGRSGFLDRWQDLLVASIPVAAGFLVWDALFARWGVWGFDGRFLLGPRVFGLPIEEWMFFFAIPFACVFTYHVTGELGLRGLPANAARALSWILFATTLACSILFTERLYTSVTSALVAVFLVWILARRPPWLPRLWLALLVLLVPFILTDGVLTGLRFWTHPLIGVGREVGSDRIVWYDNTETLGVRVFSIPIEDFLYAFLLIGLNVTLFEASGVRRLRHSAGKSAPQP